MSFFTSTARSVFFTHQILCVRMVAGCDLGLGSEADDIAGEYILHDTRFKVRVHGKVEKRIDIKDETERLEILKTYFGIEFSESDKAAINGLASALGPRMEL